MSKRCPDCHRVNEDVRSFCVYCGGALDAHVRLIQGLERQRDILAQGGSTPTPRSDIKFYNTHSTPKPKKKGSPAPWIILGLLAAGVLLYFLFK